MADTLARLLSLQRVRNGTEPGGGGDGGGESGGPQELGWLAVLTSALLIIVNITLSVRLSLGLTSKLAVAAVRCVLQLSVLGVVLEPIFDFGYHGQDGVEKGAAPHCRVWHAACPETDRVTTTKGRDINDQYYLYTYFK